MASKKYKRHKLRQSARKLPKNLLSFAWEKISENGSVLLAIPLNNGLK